MKFTLFKNLLSQMTPQQEEVAKKTFNELWEDYHRKTEAVRTLWQQRRIGITYYRQATKSQFQELRRELRERVRVII